MFQILPLYLNFEGLKNIFVLSVPIWSFWGCWMFLSWGWYLDLVLDMVTGLWYTNDPYFGSLSWFWRCKEHPCPLSPHLGLWRTLEVPDWGFASWYWFWCDHWSLVYPSSKFWLSIFILYVQRTSMSTKSWSGASDNAGGSLLGFGILILICVWSLVFNTPKFWILALCLDFDGAKNLQILLWGIGRHCRFLTGV